VDPEPLSTPRKIALFHDGNDDQYGGMEKNTLLLAQHFDPMQYDARVVLPGRFYDLASTDLFRGEAAALGVRVERAPGERGRGPLDTIRHVLRLAAFLRHESFDLVHIHTSEAFSGRRITLAGALARRPVMRTEHVPPSSYASPRDRRRVWLLDRLTRRIVVDSDANLADQVDTLRRSRKRLVRSYTGIEQGHLDPGHDVGAARVSVGLDPDRPIVGTIGRLEEQKGQRYLIAAAPTVLDRYPATQFVIVGDGQLRPELESLARELGVDGNFVFAGFQTDYLPWMRAMDVGVMPSLWEGFSLSMLEFMALGKPMVFSDEGSFVEAVRDGVSALIVPRHDAASVAEAVARLLGDEKLRQRLGQAIAQRAREGFTVERLVGEMMSLYDDVLDRERVALASRVLGGSLALGGSRQDLWDLVAPLIA
jgi:glycosyltransferase involved in cell wall biosynthesis